MKRSSLKGMFSKFLVLKFYLISSVLQKHKLLAMYIVGSTSFCWEPFGWQTFGWHNYDRLLIGSEVSLYHINSSRTLWTVFFIFLVNDSNAQPLFKTTLQKRWGRERNIMRYHNYLIYVLYLSKIVNVYMKIRKIALTIFDKYEMYKR
jgi:hypothetical protein